MAQAAVGIILVPDVVALRQLDLGQELRSDLLVIVVAILVACSLFLRICEADKLVALGPFV